MTQVLTSFQKKYLRGAAHALKPVVTIGQKGVTENLIRSVNEALDIHELIKIKFVDFKEKKKKKEILETIEGQTGGCAAGLIGHIAILYRRHSDPEKRKISLP